MASSAKRGDYISLFSTALVQCAPEVAAYGGCVGALIDRNITKDACAEQWRALDGCVQRTLRTRRRR